MQTAPTQRRVWFQLVDATGERMGDADYAEMAPQDTVASLRTQILRLHEHTIVRGARAMSLNVFGNRAAFNGKRQMAVGDSIEALGHSAEDPIFVQVERWVWFQLVDHRGQDMTDLYDLQLTHEPIVAFLRIAVVEEFKHTLLREVTASTLVIFANRAAFNQNQPLDVADSIESLGISHEDPVIVQVPPHQPPPIAITNTTTVMLVRAPRLRWKPECDLSASLSNGSLHVVNRDEAVEQLCKIHQDAYIGATNRGVRGFTWWPIALADNEPGMGKTAFGLHYIQRCRTKWPDKCDVDGFEKSLCECRTLRVVVTQSAFVSSLDPLPSISTLEATMTEFLVEAIKDELDLPHGAPLPEWLASPASLRHETFMRTLVRELGPVFIMVDSIGRAFAYPKSIADREDKCCALFLKFCSVVLSTWMATPGVYFVLMGCAPLLRKVEPRNDYQQRLRSRQKIIRLNLQLIRPPEIEQILRKTYVDSSKTQTLAQRWDLHTNEAITDAAQLLYYKTCGHPRSLAATLINYKTFDAFRRADDGVVDAQTDQSDLRTWQPVLETWLDAILSNKTIDMSKDWSGPQAPGQHQQQRTVSYMEIAYCCEVGWEGTMHEAKLYARPSVLTAMVLMVQPLRPYLRTLSTDFHRRVELTHTAAFEWACLKRFHELFNAPCSPRAVLPSFFSADTAFGQLDGIQFSDTVTDWLEITKPVLFGAWAATGLAEWPLLMREIGAKLDASATNSLCLKPYPRSLSPSVVFMHRDDATKPGSKRARDDVSARTTTVGIAVKTSEFDAAALREECKKFAAMFCGLDKATKTMFGTMTNVLIVCAARYSAEYTRGFEVEGKRYLKLGPQAQIDEVLLLDVTTREARSEFFGLADDPELADALDGLVDKA